MVGAMGDMTGREELSLSLYMFRCYLFCLYEILTVVLCSTFVAIDSNFWTLSDYQNQTSTFISLVIFGTHAFPNNKDAIEFIWSLPSAQDKQRAEQEVAEILRQRQKCWEKQCEIWHSLFMHKKFCYDVGKSTSWGKESYCDIGEFGKNHRQYKNKSEKMIFRE